MEGRPSPIGRETDPGADAKEPGELVIPSARAAGAAREADAEIGAGTGRPAGEEQVDLRMRMQHVGEDGEGEVSARGVATQRDRGKGAVCFGDKVVDRFDALPDLGRVGGVRGEGVVDEEDGCLGGDGSFWLPLLPLLPLLEPLRFLDLFIERREQGPTEAEMEHAGADHESASYMYVMLYTCIYGHNTSKSYNCNHCLKRGANRENRQSRFGHSCRQSSSPSLRTVPERHSEAETALFSRTIHSCAASSRRDIWTQGLTHTRYM